MVKVFTDGACLGNPGPGGYAALIVQGDDELTVTGGHPQTTNNRMELMAAIRALEVIADKGWPGPIVVHSDSQYVVKGITEWMANWKKKGRLQSDRDDGLANKDLWRRLDALTGPAVSWRWVRGHNGHPENERVDGLANSKAQEVQAKLRMKSIP